MAVILKSLTSDQRKGVLYRCNWEMVKAIKKWTRHLAYWKGTPANLSAGHFITQQKMPIKQRLNQTANYLFLLPTDGSTSLPVLAARQTQISALVSPGAMQPHVQECTRCQLSVGFIHVPHQGPAGCPAQEKEYIYLRGGIDVSKHSATVPNPYLS